MRLRLGFIGGGLNSAVGRTHWVASQMDGRWEVVAGAFSREQGVNAATAEAWSVDGTRVYSDWRELITLEQGRLDAVAVLTPTPQHVEQVISLLGAGYDVICEKALAGTSADAEAIAWHAKRQQRQLAVTFNYSGYPMIREIRHMVRSGMLGRVVALHIEMPQEGFLRKDRFGASLQPQAWRQHDEEVPTVSLDLGTHVHHLAHFVLDEDPVDLVAVQAHHGRVTTVTDYVSCIARYPGGIDADMWFGKCAVGYRNGLRVRIFGEDGGVEWCQMEPEFLRWADPSGQVRVVDRSSPTVEIANQSRYERFKAGHPAGFLEAFANLYCDIADTFSGESPAEGMPLVFGAEEASRGLAMLESIAESARENRWVTVAGRRNGVGL